MNHAGRIRRPLASLTRHAGALLTHRTAVPAAAATQRPQPPRRDQHSALPAPARTAVAAEPPGARPRAPRERLRATSVPARLPHAIQLCIHCRHNPAGFWVSRTGGQTVRRPWCLSCCQDLDPACHHVKPFDP
jgi:hypothetical protein